MIKLFAKKIQKPNSLSKEWLPNSYAVDLTLNNLLTPREKLTDNEYVTIVNTLNSIKHSISDYAKIITQKDINVIYKNGDESYTDGNVIVISGTLNDGNIDSTVGLVMHESSHIVYTDFNLFYSMIDDTYRYNKRKEIVKNNNNILPRIESIASKYNMNSLDVKLNLKTLANILEDRRIDFNTTNKYPAYMDYYAALYYRYFNNPEKTLAFNSNLYNDESVESYMFRICNMINPYSKEDALKGLPTIFKLIDLKNIGRFNNTAEIIDLSFDILHIIYDNCYHNNQMQMESQSDDSGEKQDDKASKGKSNSKNSNSSDSSENNDSGESGGQCGNSKKSHSGNNKQNENNDSGDNEDNGDGSNGNGDKNDNKTGENVSNNSNSKNSGDENENENEDENENENEDGDENDQNNELKEQSSESKKKSNPQRSFESGDIIGNDGKKSKDSQKNDSSKSKSDFSLGDDTIYIDSLDDVIFGDGPNATPIDGKKVILSEKAKQQLRDLLKKQQEELDGAKEDINEDFSVVNELKSKSDSIQGTGIKNYEVVFIKNINENNIKNNTYDFFHSNALNEKEVQDGIAFGKMLYKKVNVLNEIKFEKQIRRDKGHINKRLLHEIPSGNTNIFNKIKRTEYGEYNIHISLDTSGSMYGIKLKQCIKTATALCTLSNMLNNKFNVSISIRYYSNNPVVAIIYDSTKDKYTKSLLVLKHLVAEGGTPEGLCYKTLNNYILNETKHKTPYFINFSDGMPTYDYNNYSGVEHTRDMVNMMRRNGINILSYLIQDGGYMYGDYKSDFVTMYGKDAKIIDQNSIPAVAKTLNQMFIDSLASKTT